MSEEEQAGQDAARNSVENTVRYYRAEASTMMALHHRGDYEEAEHRARLLLSYGDLPLLIKCHACVILGSAERENSIAWAEEGVRTAELVLLSSRELLSKAKNVLKEAQEAEAEAEAEVERLMMYESYQPEDEVVMWAAESDEAEDELADAEPDVGANGVGTDSDGDAMEAGVQGHSEEDESAAAL